MSAIKDYMNCVSCRFYKKIIINNKEFAKCTCEERCYPIYSRFEKSVIKKTTKKEQQPFCLHNAIRPYCIEISKILRENGYSDCTKVLIDKNDFSTFNSVEN